MNLKCLITSYISSIYYKPWIVVTFAEAPFIPISQKRNKKMRKKMDHSKT